MSDPLRTLKDQEIDDLQEVGAALVVQLARTLRVVSVHSLHNEAAQQAAEDLRARVAETLRHLHTVRVQVAKGGLYINNVFLRLKGASFESGEQLEALFERLGINELELSEPLEPEDVRTFLAHFQAHVRSPDPADFAALRLPKIGLRSKARAHGVDIDRRTELARAYAQLVVVSTEAFEAMHGGRGFAVVHLRRVVQQLIEAAEGQGSLLVGLASYAHPEPSAATHAAGTAALVLPMAQQLGVSRRAQVELALCALFHDLGRGGEAAGVTRSGPAATALGLAHVTRTAEALERVAVALEVQRLGQDEDLGFQPGVPARLISVASAFMRLIQPADGQVGLRADQAVRLILDDAGRSFDRRVVRLFVSVVGLYPPGTQVRLSGDRRGVVLRTPAAADQPTVRVVAAAGQPADFVVELSAPGAEFRIVEVLDAAETEENPTHYLLA